MTRIVVQNVTFQVEQSIDPKRVCIRILPPRLHTTPIIDLTVKPQCKRIETLIMNILVFSTVAGNADNLLYLFKFLTKKGESHKHLKFHKQLIKRNFSSKRTTQWTLHSEFMPPQKQICNVTKTQSICYLDTIS